MKTLKYVSDVKIMIPKLKSIGGSLTLPKMDYSTGKKSKDQTINISDNEAGCLMRSWPDAFEEVKPKKKKIKETEE